MIDIKLKNGSSKGVSPVIAVILMVAITVILAAVIGTFVLDLGDNSTQREAQAAFDINENSGTVEIEVISISAADKIWATSSGSTVGSELTDPGAGDTITFSASAGDEITIMGELDGQDSVIRSYTVEG